MKIEEVRNTRSELTGYSIHLENDVYLFENPDKYVRVLKYILGEDIQFGSQEGISLTEKAAKVLVDSKRVKDITAFVLLIVQEYTRLLGRYQVNGEIKNKVGSFDQVMEKQAKTNIPLTPGVRYASINDK